MVTDTGTAVARHRTSVIVAASFIVMLSTWGAYSCFGVVLKDLAQHVGGSRAGAAAAYSTSALVAGVLSLATGAWTDRYGPRRMVLTSGVVFAVGLGLTATVGELWQLFVTLGLLTGAGLSGAFIPVVTLTARLPGRRSLYTGLVVSGAGCGGIVGPVIANGLMEADGWRAVFAAFGGFAALAVVVFGRLLPGRHALPPPGGEADPPAPTGSPPAVAPRAGSMWTLVILSIAYGAHGFVVIGNAAHFQAHMTDLGFTSGQAAVVVGIQAAAGVVGSFGIGAVSDRLGAWKGFVASYAVLLVGLGGVIVARNLGMLVAVAVLLGLGTYGIGAVIPGLTGELFGLGRIATMLGRLELCWAIGAWLGPTFFGVTFDATGGYTVAYATGALMVAGALLACPLVRPAEVGVPVGVAGGDQRRERECTSSDTRTDTAWPPGTPSRS